MPRLHPSITRRLHAICRGAMMLPADVQSELLDYVTEQAARVEAARALLRENQPRILGEAREAAEMAREAVARRMPMTASAIGVGWVLMAILNAWAAGYFNPLV